MLSQIHTISSAGKLNDSYKGLYKRTRGHSSVAINIADADEVQIELIDTDYGYFHSRQVDVLLEDYKIPTQHQKTAVELCKNNNQ